MYAETRWQAKYIAEVSLELGGTSPVIVFDDVDSDSVVNGAVGAIWGATGQSCVAGAAGVFTTDSARSLRVAKAVRAGIVWVNTYRAVSPIAEFGGFKGSGYGRESGFHAVYDYTRPKTIWMNTSNAPLPSQFTIG